MCYPSEKGIDCPLFIIIINNIIESIPFTLHPLCAYHLPKASTFSCDSHVLKEPQDYFNKPLILSQSTWSSNDDDQFRDSAINLPRRTELLITKRSGQEQAFEEGGRKIFRIPRLYPHVLFLDPPLQRPVRNINSICS